MAHFWHLIGTIYSVFHRNAYRWMSRRRRAVRHRNHNRGTGLSLHFPLSFLSLFFLRCKGNEIFRERSETDLFLDNKWYYWNSLVNGGCVLLPILSFGQLCLGLSANSCIHNILRRKGKANRECAKYRHPFSKSIPWHSDRQPSAVFHLKNWVFLTECPAIPCLHSLSCSPSSKRCKKLIPDGIQPIKKTAHEGQAKSKIVSPSGSSQ